MVDPITLGALTLATSAAGAGASALASASAPGPAAPAAPPPPQQQPVGTRQGNAPAQQPSFVGSSSIPTQTGFGSKTLLGQ